MRWSAPLGDSMAAKKKKAPKPAKKKAAPKKAASKKGKATPRKAAPKKGASKKGAPKKGRAAPPPRVALPRAELKMIVPKRPPLKRPAAKKAAAQKSKAKGPAPVLVVAPKPVARKAPPGPPDPTVDLAQAVAALALDKKAEDVVILKVTDLTSYADCFILASAPSERQVQSIARFVGDEMKKAGKAPVGTEGLEQGHWVLVDLGAIVLHVFLASARRYYDLEGFWSDAPRVDVDEARGLEIVAAMTAANTAPSADLSADVSGDDQPVAANDA